MKLSGREIADKLYANLQERVDKLQKQGITPHLVVILVGENPASVAYVLQKQKQGEKIGAKVSVATYNETVTTEEIAEKIKKLNTDPSVHAILLQRPVPHHIDIDKLELLTDAKKDIDGFHPDSPFTLPLPLAVVKILEEVNLLSMRAKKKSEANPKRIAAPPSEPDPRNDKFIFWLNSQNIIILGKGPTGGGPILEYFKTLNVTPNVIDSKTENAQELMKQADILIAAVGRENMVKPENLKKGVILIGVGILRGSDGKLHGDFDEEQIKDIASYYTPTPGGVGPINVAMLIDNLLTAAEHQAPRS